MTSRGNVAWHGLHAGEAVRLLGTDLENGLTESEATARLARFGPMGNPDAAVPLNGSASRFSSTRPSFTSCWRPPE